MTIKVILETKGRDIVTIAPESSVADAIAMLAQKRIGAVPVVEGGKVVGMFSERDVIYGLAKSAGAILERKVRDIMTSPAITVMPETEVIEALALMTERRVRHLPVEEDGEMIGLISLGDLVKHRVDHFRSEAEALREYIQTA